MPNCNKCGRNISTNERLYKRELYSGTSRRTNYGRRISFSASNHYSMKSVCAECASEIDEERNKQGKIFLTILLIIAIIGVLWYLVKN